MRTIFALIGILMRTAARFAAATIQLPFALVGYVLGARARAEAAAQEAAAERQQRERVEVRRGMSEAAAVRGYARAIVRGLDVPGDMDRRVRIEVLGWLESLEQWELEIIAESSTAEVRHHLSGRALIEGLEPVVRGKKKDSEQEAPDADRRAAAERIRAAVPALKRQSPADDMLSRVEARVGLRPGRA